MNILVTGTSRGIGKAIALLFLERGHTVYGFDVQGATITDAHYIHYELDIRDEAHYPSLPDIEILVNNAGAQNKTLPDVTDREHVFCPTEDIEINLKGTMAITEHYAIAPAMRAEQNGSIPALRSVIMIGSASGHTGSEFPEYAASKGGILAYTKNVALRIARYGATCNSLDYGGVLTELNRPVMEDEALWNQIMELTPLRRWMTPEEAAEWVYFMAVTNRFCTGQNILIDGLEAGNSNFIWP